MFPVIVSERRAEAMDVVSLDLRDPSGGELPAFAPGAHLDVELADGLTRQYSLLGDYREHGRYLVAVLREPKGHSTGGSEYVHRKVAVGAELKVSAPINNFPLVDAPAYRFVAGGIGITPILAMIRQCIAEGHDWHLVYAARSRNRAAFYEELQCLGDHRVRWHFDDESGAYLRVERALEGLATDELVYCCGPRALMAGVREYMRDKPGAVRFESFVTRARIDTANMEATTATASSAFTVALKRSGVTLTIPAGKSILEVLEANGFDVPFSCREGECGTCVTRVLEGVPDHRDYVLSDEERASNKVMCLCVSRARTEPLTLDL